LLKLVALVPLTVMLEMARAAVPVLVAAEANGQCPGCLGNTPG
jgi:hypothetical protein